MLIQTSWEKILSAELKVSLVPSSTHPMALYHGHQIKRQTTVATSSSHAETIGYFNAVKSCIHLKMLMKGFNLEAIKTPTTLIKSDNQCTVDMASNGCPDTSTAKTAHWRMQWNWLKEQREPPVNEFYAEHIAGVEILADGGTKPLGPTLHAQFVEMLHLGAI